MGWFCLQSCKLAGDPLLGLKDWEETGTNSTVSVQSWSLACERKDSIISKCIFQSAQGWNALGASVLLEHPNSDFPFHMEAKQENHMPKPGCSVSYKLGCALQITEWNISIKNLHAVCNIWKKSYRAIFIIFIGEEKTANGRRDKREF